MKWIIVSLVWLLAFFILSCLAFADQAVWDQNPESDLLGYRVYIGESPYMSVPFEDLEGLGDITTMDTSHDLEYINSPVYIWLTAVDTALNESEPSDYVFYSPGPSLPTGLSLFTKLMIPIYGEIIINA